MYHVVIEAFTGFSISNQASLSGENILLKPQNNFLSFAIGHPLQSWKQKKWSRNIVGMSVDELVGFQENSEVIGKYGFPFTNPSVISALEQEAAKNMEDFWWTDTAPHQDMEEGSTLINKTNDFRTEMQLSSQEQIHRRFVQDLIGDDGILSISRLVQQRSQARQRGDYDEADSIKSQIQAFFSHSTHLEQKKKDSSQYQIEIQDIPRRSGGGSRWRVSSISGSFNNANDQKVSGKGEASIDDTRTILQMAHTALGMVAFSSENNERINVVEFQKLVESVENRLTNNINVLNELQGRKAADAAFWFAIAGVTSPIIYHHLVQISCYELGRFGKRSSCRSKDIFHVVERITAAGCVNPYISTSSKLPRMINDEGYVMKNGSVDDFIPYLFQVAAECLLFKQSIENESREDTSGSDVLSNLNQTKSQETRDPISLLESEFNLHSRRSLLWIWKFSTKQRKQKAFLQHASRHWESQALTLDQVKDGSDHPSFHWASMYKDPTRPLVVDIGCGMGVSLLGLASLCPDSEIPKTSQDVDLNFSECNFLGGDLSRLAIGYASGVANRWKIHDKVSFCIASAEEMIEEVIRSYPGDVKLVMIQFPTPFRLNKDPVAHDAQNSTEGHELNHNEESDNTEYSGNSQLPSSSISGFMVSARLLKLIYTALEKASGELILQSNCEDVAVEMKNMACKVANFRNARLSNLMDLNCIKGRGAMQITKRTEDWIQMNNGQVERAEGSGWSSTPIIPSKGATETEVACVLKGTPIHRCLLKTNS